MPRRRADEHTRRGFGRIRLERSGRWSVAYVGPDGELHRPTTTYVAKDDAVGWLNNERDLIRREEWTPPAQRRMVKLERGQTFREYSTTWLATRRNRHGEPLKPRTVDLYQGLLNRHILPTFGDLHLIAITPDLVDNWHRQLLPDAPTRRAHAYALLFSILKSASSGRRRLIRENPCQVDGAAHVERKFEPSSATPEQIRIIAQEMPEKYRAFVLVAAFCGLRYGELAELRRKDIDLEAMTLRVARGVVWRKNQTIIGTPKSRAGTRTVAIPPNLKLPLEHHLEKFAQAGDEGLVFPNAGGTGHLHPSTIMKTYRKARATAGREDLRIHDLRHTHATLAAQAGATLREMMERMGQSTVEAAMVYQHVAAGRDAVIAERMAKLAEPARHTPPPQTKQRTARRRRMTDAELATFTDRARPVTDYVAERVSYGGYLDILLAEAGPVVALDAAIDIGAAHGITLTAEIHHQAVSLLQELDACDALVREQRILERLSELQVKDVRLRARSQPYTAAAIAAVTVPSPTGMRRGAPKNVRAHGYRAGMRFRQVAWVPQHRGMSWDEAAAPAVEWIEARAADEGVEPALMVNTLRGHGSGDDPIARFEARYSVVSERSATRSGLEHGPMLVYVPSVGALERAMRLANGYSICVIEGTLERWHGWAVELAALDLLTGRVTEDERSARGRELSARLDVYANNGFADALGKQVVPRIVRDLLTEGVSGDDICGIALARGCSERGVKSLRRYIEELVH